MQQYQMIVCKLMSCVSSNFETFHTELLQNDKGSLLMEVIIKFQGVQFAAHLIS